MSLDYLRETLQALAADAEVQLARFPSFVVKADELALDFDHALTVARQGGDRTISSAQLASLLTVDGILTDMSDEASAHLWTDQALRGAVEWARVREAASRALLAFDWPVDPPPPTQNVYVPGKAV